jgi:hypothetical protein
MIEKKFAYHTPSTDGLEKVKRIREAFTSLDSLVRELSPQSREQSVALTNIETAAMWAIKAVVVNDPASVAQE